MRVMRLAPLLVLAACSSPAPTSTTTHPGDDVHVTLDAAPEHARVEAPSADAAPGRCVPSDFELVALDGDGLVLCSPEEDGTSGTECLRVAPDGVAEVFGGLPTVLSDTYAAFEDREVEACVTGACKTLRPTVGKTNHVVDADLAADGARVAIALHDGRLGVATIEVWDLAKAKRIARADVDLDDPQGLSYTVGFAGDRLVVEATHAASDTIEGSLWKVAGAKLTKVGDLAGDVGTWAVIDAGRGAFLLDDRLAIVDLTSGAVADTIEWRSIVGEDEASPMFVTAGGRIGIAAFGGERDELVALGVATPDGQVTASDARICPRAQDH